MRSFFLLFIALGVGLTPGWTLSAEEISVSLSNSPAMLGVLRAADVEGVDVTFHRTQNDAVVRLVRGDVDLAILPIYVAARVHGEGTPLVLTHAVYGSFLSVVQRANAERSVSSLPDLAGTPLLIGKQAGPLLVFPELILEQGGLAGTVPTTGATAQQISQMLIAGRVQHGVLREPLTTVVLSRVPGSSRVIDLQDEWERLFGTPMVQAGIVVRRESLEEHPHEIESFLQAIDEGYRWVRDNPTGAASLAGRRVPGVNEAIIASALSAMSIRTEMISSPSSPEARRVQRFLKLLSERRPPMIGSTLPDESFYGAW